MLVNKLESVFKVSPYLLGVSDRRRCGIHLIDCVNDFLPIGVHLHIPEIILPTIILVQSYRLIHRRAVTVQLHLGKCKPSAVPIVIILKDNLYGDNPGRREVFHDKLIAASYIGISGQQIIIQIMQKVSDFISVLIVFWQVFNGDRPDVRIVCYDSFHVDIRHCLSIFPVQEFKKILNINLVKSRAFSVLVIVVPPSDFVSQCGQLCRENVRDRRKAVIQAAGVVVSIPFLHVLRGSAVRRCLWISFLHNAVNIAHLSAVRSRVFVEYRKILNNRLPAGVFRQGNLPAIFLPVLVDLHPYLGGAYSRRIVSVLPDLLNRQIDGGLFLVRIGYRNSVLIIGDIIVFQCAFGYRIGDPAAIHAGRYILKSHIPGIHLEIRLKECLFYGIADRRNQIKVNGLRPASCITGVVPVDSGIDGGSGLLGVCDGCCPISRLHGIRIAIRQAFHRNGHTVRIPARHVQGKCPDIHSVPASYSDRVRPLHQTAVLIDRLHAQSLRTIVQNIIFIFPDDRTLHTGCLLNQCVLNDKVVTPIAFGFQFLILDTVSRNLVLEDIIIDRIPVSEQRDVFKRKCPGIGITAHRIRCTHRNGIRGAGASFYQSQFHMRGAFSGGVAIVLPDNLPLNVPRDLLGQHRPGNARVFVISLLVFIHRHVRIY